MDYSTHDDKKRRTLGNEPQGRRDLMDFEHQIHCLETEAYCSILKAFIAQSDLLTWGKEGLMTELRKELNVTDVEHGEILMRINSDELVKWIREQRKLSAHAEDYVKINTSGPPFASKGNSTIISKTPSSAARYPQKNVSCSQVSLTSIPIPSPMPNVSRSHQASLTSIPIPIPSPMPNVSRSQVSLTSIPIPSPMPPKFVEDRLTAELSHRNTVQSMEMLNYNVQLPPIGRGRPPKGKHQLKKDLRKSECARIKSRSDLIEIRATDRIIHDVEKMLFSREIPDPVEIERAKLTLREQERAILKALDKLADVLDTDGSSNQTRPYKVPKDASAGQEMMIHGNYCGPFGRMNGLGDSFRFLPSG